MHENPALTCYVVELTQTMVEGEETYLLHDVGHEREPAEAAHSLHTVLASLEVSTATPCSTAFVVVLSLRSHQPSWTAPH